MDIKQDPNSIPNFNSGGRIGEHQANEPEQAESSVMLDPGADGDGAASGELSTEIAREKKVDAETKDSDVARPDETSAAGAGRTATGSDREGGHVDPSMTGGGAIDGLVGAP